MNDAQLLRAFESCELTPATFRHREHLRIAYLYLTRYPLATARRRLKRGLLRLLAHLGAPPSHYHETMTRAWLLAVDHFLHRHGPQENSGQFFQVSACLLDKEIMHTHYTPDRLRSPAAQRRFIEPDLDPIPRYA